jgi:hypothetical protein
MITKVIDDTIQIGKEPVNIIVGDQESSLDFRYFDNLKRIDFYVNNQYLDGNDGIFWNIVNSRIVHFAKNIDLDTKDLQPVADGEASYVQTWILKMKFYRWLEDNHFALTLNSRSIGLSTYGSWVWKVVKKDGKSDVENAPLQNLYFDQSVENIKDTNLVQKHYLQKWQLEGKRDVWDETAINTVLNKTEDDIEVNEFWGWYDGKYYQVFSYGEGDVAVIFQETERKEKDNPYYDYHIGEYQGRWQRIGVVERLFDLQVLANKKVNQNDKTNEIASLLLLRTADPELMGNVLQDVESGEIINSEDLEQIGLTNAQYSQFLSEMQQIETKADQLSLTPSIITAESSPANIPFRSLATLTNAGKSAFRLIKESVGESTGYLLKENIFPSVVKEWNKGEIFELSRDESDLRYFEKQMKKSMRWKTFVKNILAGRAITNEQLDEVDRVLAEEFEESPKKIQIPKDFFNFNFHIKTNITGESVDKQQRNDALFNTITWVLSNPAVMTIPAFRQYCEENGINYWRLTPDQVQEIQQGAGNVPQEAIQEGGQKDKLLSQVDSE